MIELPELSRIMPAAGRRAPEFLPHLNAAMREFDISGPMDVAAFLATCGHESLDMTRLRESFRYSAERMVVVFRRYFTPELAEEYEGQDERIANRVYANRMGNGPEESGDGWAYRGGGLIQTTGLDNYRRTGAALGVDLEGFPERIVEPEVACRAAGFFWKDNGLSALARAGDFASTQSIVNTGQRGRTPHGWADRLARYNRAMEVLA